MCNIFIYDYFSNFLQTLLLFCLDCYTLYRLEISVVIDPEILRQGEEPALVACVGAGAGHLPLAPLHLHPPPLRQGGGGGCVLLGLFKNGSLVSFSFRRAYKQLSVSHNFFLYIYLIYSAKTVMCTFLI